MRYHLAFALLPVLLASAASAKDHSNQASNRDTSDHGKIVSMEAAPCATDGNSAKADAAPGVCEEYAIQGEHVLYRVRLADAKHAVTLPVGEVAEFRIGKDNKMALRVLEVGDEKEHGFTIVSLTPQEADQTILLSSNQ